MMAFDTDVLSLILLGQANYLRKFEAVTVKQRFATIVNCEEVLRGRLHAIRSAEATKKADLLMLKYELLHSSLDQLGKLQVLSCNQRAHDLFSQWRAAKVRIGTQDLRIAAICVAHDATLVSRNRRDFDKVPELKLSVWN